MWSFVRAVVACVCVVLDICAIVIGLILIAIERASLWLGSIAGLESPFVQVEWRAREVRKLGSKDRKIESGTEQLGQLHRSPILESPHVGRHRVHLESQKSSNKAVFQPAEIDDIRGTNNIGQCGSSRVELASRKVKTEISHAELEPLLSIDTVSSRFYGVAVGRKLGVYSSWALAYAQTNKFPGNSHKSFRGLPAALMFVRKYQLEVGKAEDIVQCNNQGLVAAVWHYGVGGWSTRRL